MDEDLAFWKFLLLPLVSGGLVWLFAWRLRQRGTRAGWGRVVLGNLLGLLLLLSVLFVFGEAYYRFGYDTTDSLGFTKANERWMQRYWRTNSVGCRDNIEYSRIIKPGKRRISFLGDSFTAGHGIKEVESRFANRLRRDHPQWEIHVLAQPGFDTGEELKDLSQIAAKGYQFDQVVLVYCLNDVSDILPEWAKASERIYRDVEHSGWLRRKSYLANTLYYRFKLRREPDMKNYYQCVRGGYQGPVWEQEKLRLEAVRDVVQSHGGHLSVVTFPFLHALGPRYEYQFIHDVLDEFWRHLQVPHLDLLSVYKGLPSEKLTVNRFDAHPNEYAHALATDALGKFLDAQLAASRQTAGPRD